MAPMARISLPPALQRLTRGEIAKLYYIDRLPQVDVAAEMLLAQATIKRRLPKIVEKMQIAERHMKN